MLSPIAKHQNLAIRMRQHESNAKEVAAFLASHPKVEKTYYPGLEEHPQHRLAVKQMSGFSGIVSFDWKGEYEELVKKISRLKIFALAESLRGCRSLVNHPEKMTHASVPPELRKKLGIGPKMIRLSVGIESKGPRRRSRTSSGID